MTRPRTTETGRKNMTNTRISADYKHKLEVLERLAQGPKVDQKQAGFIKADSEEDKGHLENYRRVDAATILSTEAEEDIVLWMNPMRKEGCLISAINLLELKTLETAADEGISPDVFSASYPWRRRFMRRHSCRYVHGLAKGGRYLNKTAMNTVMSE
ncbi:hypothetical protein GN244_ATG00710 [Phytophthora infestans]|uniref:HTH CENPB-type domain-containing protein n=1 Tax=Phytophthora infestans TaxID=4787 RepID=A0A833X2M7_PHYIN|nr:hypothetical protein GN244_ATG00710 [Phytophthora infestans]